MDNANRSWVQRLRAQMRGAAIQARFLSTLRQIPKGEAWGVSICLLLAVVTRVWALNFGLPYRYHVDEPASLIAALELARGNLHITYPLLSPSLLEVLYLLLFGLLFIWDLVTGRVTSPNSFALLYKTDPTGFYLLARGLSVAASLATICLLYVMARRVRRPRTALVAGLFLSLCFLDVRHAHFAEVYSPLALLVLSVVYLIMRYAQERCKRYLVAAGLLCGVALGLRYSMLPLGGTLLLGVLLGMHIGDRKRSLILAPVLLGAALVFGFVIGAPAVFVNSQNFFKNVGVLAHLGASSQGLWGFEFTHLPTWQFYAKILEIAYGWPLVLLSLIGIGFALWRHKRDDLLLLSFPVAYGAALLTASAASSAYARYLIPVLPFLAFFAADATVTMVSWLARAWSPKKAIAAVFITSAILVVIPSYKIAQLERLWLQADTRTLALTWIEANVPEGAKIAIQWHGPQLASIDQPEPKTTRIYQVEIIDPFTSDEALYRAEDYRQKGFDYIVLSSFTYNLNRIDPTETKLRRIFYTTLDQQAELVAEFRPYVGNREPPFFFEQIWGPITDLSSFERPGPIIKVYKLAR